MDTTRLEIDLVSLRHNYAYLRKKVSPETKIMAVVKAFGYGSDASAIALELEKLGVYYFAVAYTQEGIALRKAGVKTPILVLHPQPDNFEHLLNHCLEPSIYSKRILDLFTNFARDKGQSAYPIHLKFNTGLNRLGFSKRDAEWILNRLRENMSVKTQSIFSHLVASEDHQEREFTLAQIAEFRTIAQKIKVALDYSPFLHMTNTSGVLNFADAHFDCVRVGIGLYGYGNTPQETAQLKPVARLKSVISQLHILSPGESVGYNRAFVAQEPMTTATIPIGHADGISRALGNGVGFVTVSGKRAPIIGNVCMDMIMVNVTGHNCHEGDEIEIFGEITNAEILSEKMHSISYELLTAVGQRVKRVVYR